MASYFGVIGNRDHIKIGGHKRPFWEFLDRQPSGWLSSLVYGKGAVSPEGPMIWDCGAWSYRHSDEPKYSPQQCVELYLKYAPEGSVCIAPDHMLVPGCDHAKRREINRQNAQVFIDITPKALVPMATVHGETVEERVDVALVLEKLGYRHLAIGGIAAQAAKKKMVIDIVRQVRAAVPSVHLHVLGLSSPSYAREWCRLGVDTFDGSSHFKQAFTAGAFFTSDGMVLTKHAAARPGNKDDVGIVAPECHCKSCTLLREDGVDTRSYGSNESNMGRAAHNLNMLMAAQAVAMRKQVVIVACCGKKLDHAAPAKDLYQSELFRKSRAYAEQHGDEWVILSALHGVVRPDTVLAPYDVSLGGMTVDAKTQWASRVSSALQHVKDQELVVLAGASYCGWTDGFTNVSRPLRGLGIGQQLSYLLNATNNQGGLF